MSLTLAEFEARYEAASPGEITPADVTQAYNRVTALSEAQANRLLAKAAQWKPEKRTRRTTRMAARQGGIEKSLPRGDL